VAEPDDITLGIPDDAETSGLANRDAPAPGPRTAQRRKSKNMAERYGRTSDPAPMTVSYSPEEEEAPVRGGSVGAERLDSQVQKAQEQLLNLKRQQDQIERQKRELEELSRRQEELEHGRGEMVEKLTRALVVVERQANEAQKRVEQLRATMDAFSAHLQALESISPKSWAQADLQRELNRALGMVDHARTEYTQMRSRFAADAAEGVTGDSGVSVANGTYDEMFGNAPDHSFLYWLKAGLAFTLPLLLLGLGAVFIFVLAHFRVMGN
jgi:septal ring factor EnvC (AmiA/AmiB activator)